VASPLEHLMALMAGKGIEDGKAAIRHGTPDG